MAEDIVIATMNCQGLGGKEKRKDVLNFLKQKKYSIYCIQDTHFIESEEKFIRSQWGYECFFSSFNSQSRGTAILLNNNFEHKVKRIKSDREGNKLILDIQIDGRSITLINIYGPNRDTPNFFEKIKQDIRDFNNDLVIITGDFNLVMDQEKDTKNYIHINNPRSREKVLDICAEFNLIDIWRELHMETKRYTWRTNNGNKHSRLDFFLISEVFFSEIEEAKIELGYKSDHSMVSIKIKGEKISKDRPFWKFNNSLLKDTNFVNQIKNVIEETKKQYAEQNQNIDEVSNEEIKFTVNDQLFYETLLMQIRGKTISYSCFKKKLINNRERKLIEEINILEEDGEKEEEEGREENNINDRLTEKKEELIEIRRKKLEGLMVRSRAIWVDQGEKPTKYFCNLENRNYISKYMPNLYKKDGMKTQNQKEIVSETKLFYENLYREREVKDINLNEELNFENIPKVGNEQKEKMEGLITKEEALIALKNMKNNKSPGSDGFTTEFIKFFWRDLGDFLIRSINYSYVEGELSATQKEGLITCIPKGDKDKQYLKNWRPISLLNVSYKLFSSCIANRIKTVLPDIINEDQTGFVSGRFIGENIRNLYDLLYNTEINRIPGLLLLIDFEKAFDSLEWSFIQKTLAFFNFGESIQKWVNLFYTNIKSCVLVNGQISNWFNILRGCRQGDPLSPYIFILCAEVLAIMIRNNPNISGVKIGGIEYLISQYADDTTLSLDGSEKSLLYTLKVLKFYADASGLRINMEKTKVIWFGSKRGSNDKIYTEENLCWEKNNFTLLGVKFSTNLPDMIAMNYNEKLREIKSLLLQWSKRVLTPYGKIIVIKTLAMAKINHLLMSLPSPSEEVILDLERYFFNFLWNNGPDKIKRTVSVKNYRDGGLKMLKVKPFIESLKISWLRRIISGDKKWKNLILHLVPDLTNFVNYGTDFILQRLRYITNPFWKEVFKSWIGFQKKVEIRTWNDFLAEPIWDNPKVKVGGNSVHYNNFIDKGIFFISDLIDQSGNFFEYNYVTQVLRINTNFLKFYGLLQSIINLKQHVGIVNTGKNITRPFIPTTVRLLTLDKKGSKRFYNILIQNTCKPISQIKWQTELNLQDSFKWQTVYTIINKITKDTNLKWFQLRIQHRILATNTFLTKIGIKQDNKCTFCKNAQETLIHLFYDCEIINCFWQNLADWLKNNCTHIVDLQLSKTDIIWGVINKQRGDLVINFIILLGKKFIYKNKYDNTIPNLQNFKYFFKFHYNSEKCIAFNNCEWDSFNKKWISYKNLLKSLPNMDA